MNTRYDDLNTLFEQDKINNFAAVTMKEPNVAGLIKKAFTEYLQVDEAFFPDNFVKNIGIDSKPIHGWSYVGLYAYDPNNIEPLKLVRDFDTFVIPNEVMKKLPKGLKEKISRIVNLNDDQGLQALFNVINSTKDQGLIEAFRELFEKNGHREFHFDSVTDNGYFIFYLGLTFAKTERHYPKSNIFVKLGITIHLGNIIELAIFDTQSEYEKIAFSPGEPLFFNLVKNKDNPSEIKKILEQLNAVNQYTSENALVRYLKEHPEFKNLYITRIKKITCIVDKEGNPLKEPRQEDVEVVDFNIDNIQDWQILFKSKAFKEKAYIIPDSVLYRIYLRYRWCIEKNLNYYFKQINFNKEKPYLATGDINIIYNNSLVNNGSTINGGNQAASGGDIKQKANSVFLKLSIKELIGISFGTLISCSLAFNWHSILSFLGGLKIV